MTEPSGMQDHRDQLRRTFQARGYCLLPGLLDVSKDLVATLMSANEATRVSVEEKDRVASAGGGILRHRAIDRFGSARLLPELVGVYERTLEVASFVTERKLVLSPYERSAFYIKVYDPPEGQQGWHYDTNDTSLILYLTTNTEDGATEIQCLDGETRLIQPAAGSALLLDGTKCWHRARAVTRQVKVTALLNYYTEPVKPRDPALDSTIFGPTKRA